MTVDEYLEQLQVGSKNNARRYITEKIKYVIPFGISYENRGDHDVDAMNDWCQEVCQGEFCKIFYFGTFGFEYESDATMFKLCWST